MKTPALNHESTLLVPGLRALCAALLLAAQPAAATVSYDTDGDGLIEISSLAQLNAIRWDLDGDGAEVNGADVAYAAAFPDAVSGMGCPTTAGCTGYELMADLDFDTDADGDVDAADQYWHSGAGWAPIGGFAATFEGNGHTIANLYINRSSGAIGLFGSVSAGGQVRHVGVRDVAVTGSGESWVVGGLVGLNQGSIVASYASGAVTGSGHYSDVGGLVGFNGGSGDAQGSIVASYATGAVTGPGNNSDVGGLVGFNGGSGDAQGSIVASYATGTVTGPGNNSDVGGLVGFNGGSGCAIGSIVASYATGVVTGNGRVGGLAGFNGGSSLSRCRNSSRGRIVDSYWNTETSRQASSGGGAGKTTLELRTPTGYTGIYANWNLDLVGDDTIDDPWDFGTASEYPVLRVDFDGDGDVDADDIDPQRTVASPPGSTLTSTVSYDSDGDGLIEISTLAQLNAIRWDLDGDGAADNGANESSYSTAFPYATAGMDCPTTSDDADDNDCTGYELAANLDFDTDGDGDVDTVTDEYWHSGDGWEPIGSSGTGNEFIATFEGNGHTITRMFINRSWARIGLFGVVGNGGRVRNVGVREVSVTGSSQGNTMGGLAGKNAGSITASYVTGSVTSTGGTSEVGGLVGRNGGPSDSGSSIVSSYAAASVTGPGRSRVGGLAGYNYGRIRASYASGAVTGTGNQPYVGGLVGLHNGGSIAASYATGWISGSGSNVVGGLVGRNDGGISDSYWNTATSGQVTSPGGEGKTTAELQTPTGYTGIYASWNLDLDNSDGDGDATTGGDDPWDFGTASDYPVVRLDFDGDGRATWQEFGEQRPDASTPTDAGSSDDARLKALAVSPVDIAGFSADVLSYHMGVANEVSQVTVTPYLSDGRATIDINGSSVSSGSGHAVSLSEGSNEITITVTAQDGTTTRVYTVTADRGSNAAFGWKVTDDFNDLGLASAVTPRGIWSSGTTMWVACATGNANVGANLCGYSMTTKARGPTFHTLGTHGNNSPMGIWSDGYRRVLVADANDKKIYSYELSTYRRNTLWEINSLAGDGIHSPTGITYGGQRTVWVADASDGKLYAYDVYYGTAHLEHLSNRDPNDDFNTLRAAGNTQPLGIWTDQTTMWVADRSDAKIYAYNMRTKGRDTSKDFDTLRDAGNTSPWGIWSDGTTMWVVDSVKDRIFSYNMPSRMDATLRGLTVTPRDITGFSPEVTAYHVGVANEVTQVSLTPTLNLSGGTIDLDGSSVVSGSAHAVSLSEGRNDVTITVTADDGRTTKVYTVTVGRSDTTVYGWNAAEDFNTLNAADNDYPTGLWADSTTIWVSDLADDKLYAYNRSTRDRDPGKDFDTLAPAGNTSPRGMWSDGETMWITDPDDDKIYAYNIATKANEGSNDFNTLSGAGNDYPTGIWSDGATMWVVDSQDEKIYAYSLATKARDASKDFSTLSAIGSLKGIWSDGATMWVVDDWGPHGSGDKIQAYDLTTKIREPARDFSGLTAAGNQEPSGIWSDGTTLWVANYEQRTFTGAGDRVRHYSAKIYAYNMPPRSDVGFPGAPSIRSVTPGEDSLTVSWAAPSGDGGSAISAYDLRHIRSAAADKAEASWTVVQDVWRTGSGPLSYELTGLTGGTQYDVQVRAVNGSGDGPWSATSTGTPTEAAQAQAVTDFNGDGRTDFVDFFQFIDAFGGSDPRFDLDGSGTVDFVDFFQFVDAFNQPGQAKLLALAQEMLGLPSQTQLQQNAPNPFNSETVISWFLLEPGPVRLEVFSLTGQRVAVLHRGSDKPGRHRLHWDGRDDEGRPLASGVYLYRLVTGEGVLTRKLTLLR